MIREIDPRDYVKHIVAKCGTQGKQCRSAVVFKKIEQDDSQRRACMMGFVVDNQYFIQRDTYKIYPKSSLALINYDDEMSESDME